jgi:phosphoenolpyruvate-protein kinase (PTS system EI component)
VKMAVAKGRNTRPKLKVGICGEHGGDPESVKFCHKIDLNYVSCSPFRLLTARLAAAQAALEEKLLPLCRIRGKSLPPLLTNHNHLVMVFLWRP